MTPTPVTHEASPQPCESNPTSTCIWEHYCFPTALQVICFWTGGNTHIPFVLVSASDGPAGWIFAATGQLQCPARAPVLREVPDGHLKNQQFHLSAQSPPKGPCIAALGEQKVDQFWALCVCSSEFRKWRVNPKSRKPKPSFLFLSVLS